jgi:L-2-hydroxyglutarate oxidase
MPPRPRVAIVGAGLVGLGTAYWLVNALPDWQVTVLDKESGVARHQSSHNSGVLHAGLYYKPGSIKARMAVDGIRRMVRFCEMHGIAHERCGKLVVAVTDDEVPRLRELLSRGQANGLQGLEWLDIERAREIEPHVTGVAAVRVPEEGIVDYPAVAETLRREIERAGGEVITDAEVTGIRAQGSGWVLQTKAGDYEAARFVNCAGLHSDRIARLAGADEGVRIVPFRGEYYQLRGDRASLVRNLIYPVPDPAFPFLGVHFTRLIHRDVDAGRPWRVEAGPNAVLALAREGYRWSQVNVRDAAEAIGFPGIWRFLKKYPAVSFGEVRRSLSKRLFARSLARLVPEVTAADLAPGGAGVRAQAMDRSGALLQDFVLVRRPNALHVVNAPSPGATASLAIGEMVGRELFGDLVPAGNGALAASGGE